MNAKNYFQLATVLFLVSAEISCNKTSSPTSAPSDQIGASDLNEKNHSDTSTITPTVVFTPGVTSTRTMILPIPTMPPVTIGNPKGTKSASDPCISSGDSTDNSGAVIVTSPPGAWGGPCGANWVSNNPQGTSGAPTQTYSRIFFINSPVDVLTGVFQVSFGADDNCVVSVNGTVVASCDGMMSGQCFDCSHSATVPNSILHLGTNTLTFEIIDTVVGFTGGSYLFCGPISNTTVTPTDTPTPGGSPTATMTFTPTNTFTPTPTNTPTDTFTPTSTFTDTSTPSPPTPTFTPNPLAKCIKDAVDQFKKDRKLCGSLKFTAFYQICIADAVHALQNNLAGCIPVGQ